MINWNDTWYQNEWKMTHLHEWSYQIQTDKKKHFFFNCTECQWTCMSSSSSSIVVVALFLYLVCLFVSECNKIRQMMNALVKYVRVCTFHEIHLVFGSKINQYRSTTNKTKWLNSKENFMNDAKHTHTQNNVLQFRIIRNFSMIIMNQLNQLKYTFIHSANNSAPIYNRLI